MADKPVFAENGMVIGVSGIERLCCPKCRQPLKWNEHNAEARVQDVDGALVPKDDEVPADMGRASPKEAFCCDTIILLEPWAAFRITTTKLEVEDEEPPQ